jgi:hypothetical protein
MANIRKRNNKWHVSIRNKYHSHIYKAFLSKQDADKYVIETERQIQKGLYEDLSEASQITLADVLKKNINHNQEIDLLSVDVEGLDLDVLKSNDWHEFLPKVIIVECLTTHLEDLDLDPIYLFLKEKGYSLYGKSGYSFIFISEGV